MDNRLNNKTKLWCMDLKPFMKGYNYVRSSCGILNAASTTLSCCTVMHRMDVNRRKVVTLKSSDNSMTGYVTSDPHFTRKAIK